jgi:hypothetical protein
VANILIFTDKTKLNEHFFYTFAINNTIYKIDNWTYETKISKIRTSRNAFCRMRQYQQKQQRHHLCEHHTAQDVG